MTQARFTETEIEKARNADVVSLVAQRVELKRKGSLFWGLCPFHKEKSPSFKVDNVRRAYHCFGCGAGGDAIDWLIKMEAMSFPDAVKALNRDALPETKRPRPFYAPKPAEEREPFLEALRMWDAAKSARGTVVEEYLRARGIKQPVSEQLRFSPRLRHGPTKRHFRAMLARISDDRGFCAVQRTFLVNDKPDKIRIPSGEGKNLPAKMTKGPMRGGAVRLRMPAGEMLGLAEGVETALSAAQLYSLPVWAVCGKRFGAIELPAQIKQLVIFGDPGDDGRQAAFDAQDFWEMKGLRVEVIFPAADFKKAGIKDDFNDLLKAGAIPA
jgi:DNA primase